jgi:ABC-type phosphate transport system ATPase subunit
MVSLAFKTLLSPLGIGKKTFLSTLNIMILQMVRNEHLRFGGHVDIEVRYKILRLDVLKKTQILHNLSCFE